MSPLSMQVWSFGAGMLMLLACVLAQPVLGQSTDPVTLAKALVENKQAGAAFAFQCVELATQDGLVAVQKQRRARQAAELADRDEGPPFVQVGGNVQAVVGRLERLHAAILRHALLTSHDL